MKGVRTNQWRAWIPSAPLILLASLGCDTRNIGTYYFEQVVCVNSGPDLETSWFGDLEKGRTAVRPFDLFNSSTLTVENANGDYQYIQKDSRIRLLGFSVTQCSAGDADAYTVHPRAPERSFPIDLEAGEEIGLLVEFAPMSTGPHECSLEPDYEILVAPGVSHLRLEREGDYCTLRARGTGLPGPEPVCTLDPPSAEIEFGQVEVGAEGWQSVIIRNETPELIPTNQFFYTFDEGSNDCAFFTFDPPEDNADLIGPSGSKQVVTRFSPNEAREFQCSRGLTVLDAPGGTPITNACTSPVMWTGTGVTPPPDPPTWAACSSETRTMDLHTVTGLSADQVFIAGDAGVVLTPVGTASCQWQAVGTGFTEVDLRDLWVHEAGGQMALWAVGNIPPDPGFFQETGAVLFSETVSQAGWSQIDEDDLQTFEAVWGSGLDDVYFAGLGVSTDFPNAKWYAGDPQTLEKFTISWSGMSTVTGMDGTGPNDVWAVLHESWNAVYRFSGSDPTQEWEDMTPPYAPISPLNDIWIGSGDGFDVVYAVGDAGAVYRYDRQQSQWLDPESIAGQEGDFHGVWVSPTGTVFAVGEGPMIYEGHVNEPGQWTRHTIPATAVRVGDVLFDVWGTDDDNVYAVGTNGIILRYAPQSAASVASR